MGILRCAQDDGNLLGIKRSLHISMEAGVCVTYFPGIPPAEREALSAWLPVVSSAQFFPAAGAIRYCIALLFLRFRSQYPRSSRRRGQA